MMTWILRENQGMKVGNDLSINQCDIELLIHFSAADC